jgi:hypothetical protein
MPLNPSLPFYSWLVEFKSKLNIDMLMGYHSLLLAKMIFLGKKGK